MHDQFAQLWPHLIHPLLDSINAKEIVEIGSSTGQSTKQLIEFCTERQGTLHVIDPSPHYDPEEFQEKHGSFTFYNELSLVALPKLQKYDAILIDGDHNWYTLTNELLLIEAYIEKTKASPLIIMHDVGWPYARRDMYYKPESIPAEFRQPYEKKGILPGLCKIVDKGGFNPMHYHATNEGGERNGILTAIEDFLSQTKHQYTFIHIPGLHGLGILAPQTLVNKKRDLAILLETLSGHAKLIQHIKTLEQERVRESIQMKDALMIHKLLLKRANQSAAAINTAANEEHRKICENFELFCQEYQECKQALNREKHAQKHAHAKELVRLANEWQQSQAMQQRILRSKSWRWTGWLRKLEQRLRRNQQTHTANQSSIKPVSVETGFEVSLIIPCHNYGQFLAKAIESALAQTYRPTEILVMDDASSDDTEEIAKRYSEKGVRYERCEHKSLALTRNEGAMLTESPFLMYLDADDHLPPNYIEKCIALMHDPAVALAYGNMQNFGEDSALLEMPLFDQDRLERQNYISSHALIRRQALDVAGGYRQLPNFALEDWDFYRRVLRYPWTARKADTFVYYNVHKNSMLLRPEKERTYCGDAALLHQPITIFTPFAGRGQILDRYLDALRNLEFDPSLIHLHCFDTSDDPAFSERLQSEMGHLPFGRVTYTKAPLPALWKQTPEKLIRNRVSDRENAQYYYELAVVYAYNTLLASCPTEYVLAVEDDVILEPATLKKMFQAFDEETVAVVAHYPCHLQGYSMVWKRVGAGVKHFPERRSGIEEVGGSGFGCSLFRTSTLSQMPIYTRVDCSPKEWYDHIAFKRLGTLGKIVCNWDVELVHVNTKRYKGDDASDEPSPPIPPDQPKEKYLEDHSTLTSTPPVHTSPGVPAKSQ